MSVRERTMGDVAVLSVKGKLWGGAETRAVHETVKRLIRDGFKKVVIDLSGVKWLNSLGLGVLIGCLTSLRNEDGDLRLVGVTERVHSLLMVTNLITVFQTFETVEQAVESFQ